MKVKAGFADSQLAHANIRAPLREVAQELNLCFKKVCQWETTGPIDRTPAPAQGRLGPIKNKLHLHYGMLFVTAYYDTSTVKAEPLLGWEFFNEVKFKHWQKKQNWVDPPLSHLDLIWNTKETGPFVFCNLAQNLTYFLLFSVFVSHRFFAQCSKRMSSSLI